VAVTSFASKKISSFFQKIKAPCILVQYIGMKTNIRFGENEELLDIRYDHIFKAVFTQNTQVSKGALSDSQVWFHTARLAAAVRNHYMTEFGMKPDALINFLTERTSCQNM